MRTTGSSINWSSCSPALRSSAAPGFKDNAEDFGGNGSGNCRNKVGLESLGLA